MSVDRMQIIGIEGNADISKKTGNAFDMSRVHTLIELAPLVGKDKVAKGMAGDFFDVSREIISRIEHLQPPFLADVERRDVIKYGKRVNAVTDIRPVERSKPAA